MSTTFFTSDQHFFHQNIIKLCNRPFSSLDEMHNVLIENWNNVVSEDDTVYILGDFSLGRFDETIKIWQSLKGKKFLMLGNHDKFAKNGRIENAKTVENKQILEVKISDKIYILSHYPILEWNGFYRGYRHLYGHTHHSLPYYDQIYPQGHNAVHVGVDDNGFTPVNIEEIERRLTKFH